MEVRIDFVRPKPYLRDLLNSASLARQSAGLWGRVMQKMCLRVSADLLRPLGPLSPVCSSPDDMPGFFEGLKAMTNQLRDFLPRSP
jgi:hypothetical protein